MYTCVFLLLPFPHPVELIPTRTALYKELICHLSHSRTERTLLRAALRGRLGGEIRRPLMSEINSVRFSGPFRKLN